MTSEIASDGAEVTCGGRLFQTVAPETGKARFPTVERLNGGTASWLVEVDRSLCRDGTSVTRSMTTDWCTAVQGLNRSLRRSLNRIYSSEHFVAYTMNQQEA